jgi:hypothetical protein
LEYLVEAVLVSRNVRLVKRPLEHGFLRLIFIKALRLFFLLAFINVLGRRKKL